MLSIHSRSGGIKKSLKIYIFGAHSRAQTLAVYLQYLHPDMEVEAYLYENDEMNPEKIGNAEVVSLNSGISLHTDYPVYVGTRGVFHRKITERLEQIGFKTIIPVTVELDLRLRNEYLKKYFASAGRDFVKIDKLEEPIIKPRAAVYVAMSAFDKPLQQDYVFASYEKGIQAGAELTEKRLWKGILTDHIGDNISAKNEQFCELTALYWIWKNAKEDIVGLVHYRRHFVLPEDWVERMLQNKVDVVLPVPLYVAPSVVGNYKNRHDSQDWDNMMKYLKDRNEREYEEADAFFRQNLYSPCNMAIMQREVLDRLCGWLFPILFAVAKDGGRKKDPYQNRYPGFLSERLITFFFERNRAKYNVAYADKNFLA